MSINPEDVKLYESQRLSDESDGGGRATGREVEDGQVNNLFEDVSRLDRTVGDVSLRKAFVGIDTNNADLYLGAHAIITEPPADPLVEVVMFDAGSESDTRVDAQDRIEAYSVKGSAAQWELIGTQYENQRQVVAVQRQDVEIPTVGEVFVLSDNGVEQYIRITDVDDEIATFSYQSGGTWVDFERRRLVLSISSPLEQDFRGGQVTPGGTTGPKSSVFTTEVADAARYWGVKALAQDAAEGDLSLEVESIYANIVPSAQTESPIIDMPLGYDRVGVRASADEDLTENLVAQYTSSTELQVFLNRAAVPGTVALTLQGSTYADDGSGILTRETGALGFSELQIDYDTGAIFGTRDAGTGSGTVTGAVTYRPGAPFTGRTITDSIEVTQQSRSFNYIRSFVEQKPRPGTMVVSYMALNKWYELRDNGAGKLEGPGSGTVDFVTGTVALTLDALPDVGSSIIFSFLLDFDEETVVHSGEILDAIPEVELQLDEGVQPSTLSIDYISGSVAKNITDDGQGGLTGDGTGTIDYGSGVLRIKPDALLDDGTGFDVDYNAGSVHMETGTGNGTVSGTLDNAPVMPGSVSLWIRLQYGSLPISSGKRQSTWVKLKDNGAGAWSGGYQGGINYATGSWTLTFTTSENVTGYNYYQTSLFRGRVPYSQSVSRTVREYKIWYREQTDTAAPETLSGWTPSELVLELLDPGDDILIAGSLLFDFAGDRYYDRNGILYKQLDSKTGAGTAVGTVNYEQATASLDTWPGGAAPGVTLLAALTAGEGVVSSTFTFRTPGAPIRPLSMTIVATDIAGNAYNITSDSEGNFQGGPVVGSVNYETGVVSIRFTNNEADDTGASEIGVQLDALYSAVLYSFLPLDADLIGLDPVRLPSDGRVPIYRQGDIAVIINTQDVDVGTPAAGWTEVLPRDFLAGVEVIDSNGKALDPAQYTVDLEGGQVSFADPLTLQEADTTPLVPPITIRHRVEHMTLLNDVQIGGRLSFISPLGHDFPAAGSVVCSALPWGDLNSRVYGLFTQKTWDSGDPNWTDSRIGDDTTAQYNDIDYPLEYANNGAVTERWALWFYSSTSFSIVGKELGIIGQGNTSVDCAPVNPNTGNPYFVIRADGWGTGWSTNNVVRFNTEGCLGPVWLARTVLSGQSTVDDDSFTLQLRGDAD